MATRITETDLTDDMDGETSEPLPAPSPRPKRGFRGTGRLIAAAIRLVWLANRKDFIVVMLMDLLQAVGIFALILQVPRILDSLMAAEDGETTPGLPVSVLLLVLANSLIMIAEAVVNNRRAMLSERTGIYVRNQVLEVACLAKLIDFDDSAFHDRLQRTARNSLTYPAMMVESLVTIAQSLFTLIAVPLALVTVQPWVALVVALAIVPIWVGGSRGGEYYFDFVVGQSASDRNRFYLFDLLTNRESAKEIRAFNLEHFFTDRWSTSMQERLVALAETLRKRLRTAMGASLGSGLVLAVALGVLIVLTRSGFMNLAETATVGAALLVVSQRLNSAVDSTNAFFQAAPLVGDLNDFLELKPALVEARPTEPAPHDFEKIEVENVSFTYLGAGRPAIDNVSMTIEAGEVIALVGENGSGKTTLTKLLAGLYGVDSGRILVDETELGTVDPASWRESVAVLFQDFLRYLLPAAENISLGDVTREPTEEAIRTAARQAGADEFLSALPEGYRTILAPEFGRGQDLSLGQWQRVALARAFFRPAPLVILDEPTASLDARAERELFNSVRDLFIGRTVLLISHRFSTVRTADRIVVLADGRVTDQGTHEELMERRGLYAELFNIQASNYLRNGSEEDTDVDEVTAVR